MLSLIEIAVSVLILIGVLFTATAAIGVWRLPDVYCRAHASGLSTTLGVLSFMLAALVYFTAQTGSVPIKLLLVALFIFFTGPISGHMLSRAAYFIGVEQHKGKVLDDMADYTPPRE